MLPTSVLPRAKNQITSRQPPFLNSLAVVPTVWRRSMPARAYTSISGSTMGSGKGMAMVVATSAARRENVFMLLDIGVTEIFLQSDERMDALEMSGKLMVGS